MTHRDAKINQNPGESVVPKAKANRRTRRLVSTAISSVLSCLLLAACSPTTEPQAEVAAESQAEPEQVFAMMQKWSRSCALCHISGVGGAPRAGISEEWVPRLAEGKAVLLKHTIEGYNNMPPLGYCMSCEEEDFVALIDFMLGETP